MSLRPKILPGKILWQRLPRPLLIEKASLGIGGIVLNSLAILFASLIMRLLSSLPASAGYATSNAKPDITIPTLWRIFILRETVPTFHNLITRRLKCPGKYYTTTINESATNARRQLKADPRSSSISTHLCNRCQHHEGPDAYREESPLSFFQPISIAQCGTESHS